MRCSVASSGSPVNAVRYWRWPATRRTGTARIASARLTPAGARSSRRALRHRLGEADEDVCTLHLVELHVDEVLDCVYPERAREQDRDRSRDAGDGERGAHGLALEVTQDHALRRREDLRVAVPLDEKRAELGRGGRAQGLGRAQLHHAPDRRERAAECGNEGGSRAGEHHPRQQPEVEQGEMEEVGVEPGHGPPQPPAEGDPDRGAEQHDDRGELEVVPGDHAVVVAERLQRRDLPALRVHLPVQHDVQDERRDKEKDRRQYEAEYPLLVDLLRHDLVRDLVLASHRAEAAVGLEQPVERVAAVWGTPRARGAGARS
jgi:hypothetical protein